MPSWIFQGNPDTFDIDGYFASTKRVRWLVRQHAEQVAVGDTVYFWRASGKSKQEAGIVAMGKVSTPVAVQPDDAAALEFWRDPAEGQTLERRVTADLARVANKRETIRRDWLVEDPICADLPNIRFTQATNYPLEPRHAERLTLLWSRTGRVFDRFELLVCLLAYADTFGQPVSKLPGSPVSRTSVEVGRAVSSVYAKLMNFRSLDPRHDGAGQANIGEGDRTVWNEFWTGSDIDRPRLEQEIAGLRSPGNDPRSLAMLELEVANEATTEGARRLVTHLRLERDRRVVQTAKALWASADPMLRCEVCQMSFAERYGSVGEDFIEAHHLTPLADNDGPRQTAVEDLAPVCANCHRMLHRGGGVSLVELRSFIQSAAARSPGAAAHSEFA